MKVVVFGGSGFIGSHVVDNLRDRNIEVTIFDRYPRKYHRDDVNTFLGDIKDRDAVFDVVYNNDGVINLAGLLGTQETINNPIPSVEVNVIGAINVFDAVRMRKKRAVQIAVGNHWMNNSYSISKTTAERFALMYNKEHKTEIAIVRGLNVYGERQKSKPVKKIFPNLVIPALLNEPISIYGDGEQIMDMIYAKDCAEILVRSLIMDHGVYDKIFEAGMGDNTTVNDLARLVIEETGSSSRIECLPMRPGEPSRSIVKGDPTTLAPLQFSKEQLTSLKEGVRRSVKWYRENLSKIQEG